MVRLTRFLIGCAVGAALALLLSPRTGGEWRRVLVARLRGFLRSVLFGEAETGPAPQVVQPPVQIAPGFAPAPEAAPEAAATPEAPPPVADLRARVEETRQAVKEALERPFATEPEEAPVAEEPEAEEPAEVEAAAAEEIETPVAPEPVAEEPLVAERVAAEALAAEEAEAEEPEAEEPLAEEAAAEEAEAEEPAAEEAAAEEVEAPEPEAEELPVEAPLQEGPSVEEVATEEPAPAEPLFEATPTPAPEVVVWPDVEDAFPPLPRREPVAAQPEPPGEVWPELTPAWSAPVSPDEQEALAEGEAPFEAAAALVAEVGEQPVEFAAREAASESSATVEPWSPGADVREHGEAEGPATVLPTVPEAEAYVPESYAAEPEPEAAEAVAPAGVEGMVDQVEMRRRIEETRNRLKAKAFDAMASGEAALLSRDVGERPVPEKEETPLDEDVQRALDQSLSQEDY